MAKTDEKQQDTERESPVRMRKAKDWRGRSPKRSSMMRFRKASLPKLKEVVEEAAKVEQEDRKAGQHD